MLTAYLLWGLLLGVLPASVCVLVVWIAGALLLTSTMRAQVALLEGVGGEPT
ncbi:hypothetical protein [Rubellimicrobium mesophilum]|uniref:hypothetical protein n=1 Tax=Rubellimicrobium mesophilum TaxID=1123067 RepID=UPI0012E1C8FB|nr:hypothetical protein [Rubellimicrobium mesophilum]